MIRTQVYLPEDLHRQLMLLAKTRKVNFSSLVREGVAHVVNARPRRKKNVKWGEGFIGAIKTKEKTNAVEDIHDYYLHGVIK